MKRRKIDKKYLENHGIMDTIRYILMTLAEYDYQLGMIVDWIEEQKKKKSS